MNFIFQIMLSIFLLHSNLLLAENVKPCNFDTDFNCLFI